MPDIHVTLSDGTVVPLPENAAAYSNLVKDALDSWAKTYEASSPASSVREEDEEDDDEEEDNDDDDDDSDTSYFYTSTYEEVEEDSRDGDDGNDHAHDDDDDDDDGPSSALVRASTEVGESGKCSVDRSTGSLHSNNSIIVDGKALHHAPHDDGAVVMAVDEEEVADDGSATPSTLDEEDDGEAAMSASAKEEDDRGTAIHVDPHINAHATSGAARSRKQSKQPLHAHDAKQHDEEVFYNSADSAIASSASADQRSSTVVLEVADEGGNVEVHDDDDDVVVEDAVQHHDDAHVVCRDECPVAREELRDFGSTSPSSVHQRTPCMIGAEEDDEALHIISGDSPSDLISSDWSNNNSGGVGGGGAGRYNHGRSPDARAHHPTTTTPSSSSSPSAANHHATNSAESPAHRRRSRASPAKQISPRADKEVGIMSTSSSSIIAAKDSIAERTTLTATAITIDLSAATAATTTTTSDATAGAPSSSSCANNNNASSASFEPESVALCLSYLSYFSPRPLGSTPAIIPRPSPTNIAMPLRKPLPALISDWELRFLYVDVLGLSEEAMAADREVLDVCPSLDYRSPSLVLSVGGTSASKRKQMAAVQKALHGSAASASTGAAPTSSSSSTPPLMQPTRVGLRRLHEVLHISQQLQLTTLHDLCAAWTADRIIRAAYSTDNSLSAAQIIREMFFIDGDWNKKETSCLQIENEWPSNEREAV